MSEISGVPLYEPVGGVGRGTPPTELIINAGDVLKKAGLKLDW